jgi:RING finger protein 113A
MFNRADKVIAKMNKKRQEKEDAEEDAGVPEEGDVHIEAVGDDSADEDEE